MWMYMCVCVAGGFLVFYMWVSFLYVDMMWLFQWSFVQLVVALLFFEMSYYRILNEQ